MGELRYIAEDIVCGGLASAVAQTLCHPIDTIKIRLVLQPDPPIYNGIADCAMKTFRSEGIRGFFKGVLPPVLGAMPQYSLVFAGKEFSDRMFLPYSPFELTPLQ